MDIDYVIQSGRRTCRYYWNQCSSCIWSFYEKWERSLCNVYKDKIMCLYSWFNRASCKYVKDLIKVIDEQFQNSVTNLLTRKFWSFQPRGLFMRMRYIAAQLKILVVENLIIPYFFFFGCVSLCNSATYKRHSRSPIATYYNDSSPSKK